MGAGCESVIHRYARRFTAPIIGAALVLSLLIGCCPPVAKPVLQAAHATLSPASTAVPTDTRRADGLSEEEVATLSSLEKVDDYPLYVMHYAGAYRTAAVEGVTPMARVNRSAPGAGWACSLFAALGDADNMLYGRNFDWDYSPALLLFTDPPDGYASVSMVDIAYLGFADDAAGTAADLPLGERRALLNAPFLPFDGMNEQGLVVGMAAVAPSPMPSVEGEPTIDSLGIIREMLDRARDVDEATDILHSYNIDWDGGPALHYLIADASGHAALVEFFQGEMVIVPNATPWHHATNFLLSAAGASAAGLCRRYDRIGERLLGARGQLSVPDAMDLLACVRQDGTQWSVVYGLSTGDIRVAMGRQYKTPHTFRLSVGGD